MRSGAVTNRTYRAWGKIKLPKYLFKLHKVCATIYVFDMRKRNLYSKAYNYLDITGGEDTILTSGVRVSFVEKLSTYVSALL